MSSHQRSKYEKSKEDDDFEIVQSTSQPHIRELLDLLSSKLPTLVQSAKHELEEELILNTEAESTKHLKKNLKEAQKRIDELELKLGEKDQGIKSYQSTNSSLEDKLDHEQKSKMELERRLQESSKHIEKLTKEVQTANAEKKITKRELQDKAEELRKTKCELEDTKTRLSRSMGDKLTDSNPDIADLSDKNRPTKLAERYQEIYDNEWTDAFEIIQKIPGEDEKNVTSVLISILMDTMSFCQREAELHMKEIEKAMIQHDSSSPDTGISQNVKKQLKDCRKAVAQISAMHFYKKYEEELQMSFSSTARKARMVPKFVKACFNFCWLSSVQDPPIVFAPNVNTGDRFDNNVYKAYTRSGDRVEFVVWPALLLHQNGPVLCKGIAQCIADTSRRQKSPSLDDHQQDYAHKRHFGRFSGEVKPLTVRTEDSFYARDLTRSLSYKSRTDTRGYENYVSRYNVDFIPSYQQTVPRKSHLAYKSNMYQYDNATAVDTAPSESDIDNYFRHIEMFGRAEAKIILGSKYDICYRYINNLN